MTVSLSIKEVPEALAARLRERAARNHRSLQRELMALIEAATEARPLAEAADADSKDQGGTPVARLPPKLHAPVTAMAAMEREAPYALAAAHTVSPSAAPALAQGADQPFGTDLPAPGASAAPGQLLAELDAIVAGSRFGAAPLLPREQLHERALARELEFDCHAEPSSRPGR